MTTRAGQAPRQQGAHRGNQRCALLPCRAAIPGRPADQARVGEGDGVGLNRRWCRRGCGVVEGEAVGPIGDGDGDATGTPEGTGLAEATGAGAAPGTFPMGDGEAVGVAEPALPIGDGVGLGACLCAKAREWLASDPELPCSDGAASAIPTPPATMTTAAGAATHHCLRDKNLIRNLRFRLTDMPAPVSTAGSRRRLH
jgi:hypothetical protein